MAYRWTSRVEIDQVGVDTVFAPGRDVWSFMALLGTEHLNAAIAFAPARSGRLKAAHYPVPIMTPVGRRSWRYTIRNDAEYAAFVHNGTTGPIYPNGSFLSVPRFRGTPYPRMNVKSVSGQMPNPWIWKAWEFVSPF